MTEFALFPVFAFARFLKVSAYPLFSTDFAFLDRLGDFWRVHILAFFAELAPAFDAVVDAYDKLFFRVVNVQHVCSDACAEAM